MQLIYDDYDSKVNDRCYEVGRMYWVLKGKKS